jgi:hypothetical protein
MKRVLLVEPNYPIHAKSRNHKNFLPIGLLKIAAYLRAQGTDVKLVRGTPGDPSKALEIEAFAPDQIWVTSLFTYWAECVRKTVRYYRNLSPRSWIVVGGIYASLFPKDQVKEYVGCDEVRQGTLPEAEEFFPAYDLVDAANGFHLDYQIVHASRGCSRRCDFCGTWRIEPDFAPRSSIADMIRYKKIVFYDNNLLMNPFIENILRELAELKRAHRIWWCESQSGLDGRILLNKPHLAEMIKSAGFRYPRIAWDGQCDEYPQVQRQLELLESVGYPPKDTSVFMIYNWNIPFSEMERKRIACWRWKVQIADCRYRPLDCLIDHYCPNRVGQTCADYHIHKAAGWTDALVKQFRRNVREQNICVRHRFPFFSKALEAKLLSDDQMHALRSLSSIDEQIALLQSLGRDVWVPDGERYPVIV